MEEENKKIEINASTMAVDEKEKLKILDAKKIVIEKDEKEKEKTKDKRDEDIIH